MFYLAIHPQIWSSGRGKVTNHGAQSPKDGDLAAVWCMSKDFTGATVKVLTG